MYYFGKEFRSFNTGNIRSVGERALNLLPVKVGVPNRVQASLAQVQVRLGWNHFQSLMTSNFAAL